MRPSSVVGHLSPPTNGLRRFAIVALLLLATPSVTLANTATAPRVKVLDSSCTVSMLNRSVQAGDDGTWTLSGVPSFLGLVRARATCTGDDYTYSGQSEFFNLTTNAYTEVQDIYFDDAGPVPISLEFKTPGDITLNGADTYQLTVLAAYSDGTFSEPLNAADGVNFVSSTPTTVEIGGTGLLKPISSGNALIIVRLEGVLAFRSVRVILGGDSDGDGLDDSYELANGLDPSDPADAMEDQDGDGLSALKEFQVGTNPLSSDTDGDDLTDDEELSAGVDGFFSNPLAQDTDGDGFADALESQLGTDPSDPNDYDLERALSDIRIEPSTLTLTYNSVDTEAVGRIRILGELSDGSTIDITAPGYGVHITSADLGIASFGVNPGEVLAGEGGTTTISARYSMHQDSISVAVDRFDPIALSAVGIVGYANNVDVQGDYAYIAAGESGLLVVDVSDRKKPRAAGRLNTDGTAIDIVAFGNFVYLADGSAGIKIIDVSDKRNPVLAGQLQIGGIARDLALAPPYLYVAAEDAGVAIVSIADSTAPFLVEVIDDIGMVSSVAVDGSRLAVATDSQLQIYDLPNAIDLIHLSSIGLRKIKNITLRKNSLYVASFTNGARSYEISSDGQLIFRTTETRVVPRDVVLRDKRLFFAEQRFPNIVAIFDAPDAANTQFSGIIDLYPLADYAGTGISVDSQYVYVTEENFIVTDDYKELGDTRLFIAQYRKLTDNFGVAPSTVITSPTMLDTLVEGQSYIVKADANDDVAIRFVDFIVDGQSNFIDTVAPYQMMVTVPLGAREITLASQATDLGGNVSSVAVIRLPVQADSDSDGLGDGEEQDIYLTQVNKADSDEDGAEDGLEVRIGTDPLDRDTDDDGVSDGDEIDNMTDPRNPDVILPVVSSLAPADGSMDINESTTVNIEFSERISRRSLQGVLTVKNAQTNEKISGSARVSKNLRNIIFEPFSLLHDYTEYRITLEGVSDLAGNLLEPFSSTFTTGNYVDNERPFAVSVSPAQNATSIAVSSVFSIVMNEPIKRESVKAHNIYLEDEVNNQRVQATLTLNENRDRILLIPDRALAIGRLYTLHFINLIDLFGNASIYTKQSFTTSFFADEEPPTVVATSMADGQQDVPINAWVEILFNEPVNPSSIYNTVLLRGGEAVPLISRSLDPFSRRLRLHYKDELMPNTSYVLSIEGVSDTNHNSMSSRTEIAFTTSGVAEAFGFRILESNTHLNQNGVPLDARLTISFSLDINQSRVSGIRLHDSTDNVEVPATVEIVGTRQLRISPLSPMHARHTYRTILGNMHSLAGAPLRTHAPAFTTGEVERTDPLQAVEWLIEDDYTAMPVNGSLIVRFSSSLDHVACPVGSAVTISDSNDESVEFNWEFYGRNFHKYFQTVLRIRAKDTGWQPETSYTVRIAGLCDIAGNLLNTAVVRRFSTSDGQNVASPTVTSVSPSLDASDVAVLAAVTWRFSEPVWLTEGDSGVHDYVYVESSRNWLSGDYTWDASHTTLTFTPSSPYPNNTQIDACLSGARLVGISGKPVSAQSVRAHCSRFTTVAGEVDIVAPSITTVMPADGAVDIDRRSPIVIVFSEPIDARSLSQMALALYINGIRTPTGHIRSIDNRTVTLSPQSIPGSAVISVVATSEITDLAGNSLLNFVSVYTTSATRDEKRPAVQAVYPGMGAANVESDTDVLIYFSEQVNASTLTDQNLLFSQNGVLADGVITVLGDGRAVSFRPTQSWQPSSTIEIFARNGIADRTGNPLSEYQSVFRTAAPDTVPSRLMLTSTSHLTDLPINARIGLLFSKSLNPASVSAETVRIYDAAGLEVTAGVTLELSRSDTLLELSSADGWQPTNNKQRWYRIVLGALRATDASQSISPGQNIYFYLRDNPELDTQRPILSRSSPVDGASQIGANAKVAWGFSERINPLSFDRSLFENQPYSIQLSDGDKQVEYVPHRPFALSSDIELAVPSVSDDAGNTLDAQIVRFSTAAEFDWRAPVRTGITPGSETSNSVPVNAVFEVSFDESVSPISNRTVQASLFDYTLSRSVEADVSLSEDFKTVYLMPVQNLEPGRRYEFQIAVNDMTLRNQYDYSYILTAAETADTAAPVLVGTNIANGQTNVPTNAFIDLLFDEPVNPLTLKGIKLLNGGEAIPVKNHELSEGNRRLRLRIDGLLPAKAVLMLRVADVQDRSGNRIAEPIERTFSTAATVNSHRFAILQQSIARVDLDVPLNPKIVVSFNQPVSLLDLEKIGLIESTDIFQNVTINVETDGPNTLIITPEEILDAGKQHRLFLPIRSQTYSIENNIRFPHSVVFTTGNTRDTRPPAVANASIANGQTDVPTNAFIDLLFDEPVSPLTLSKIELLTDGSTVAVSSRTLSEGNRRLRLAPAETLIAETAYTIRVADVEDRSGNRITKPSERIFTTGVGAGSENLNIQQKSITYDDQGVPLNPRIVLSLSQPVNPLDIEKIYLWNNTDSQTVAVSVETGGLNTIIITPKETLQADKYYWLYPTIHGLTGGSWDLSSEIRFTTGNTQDNRAPAVANASIANGQTDVPTNAFIDLLFDEPVSPPSLSKVELLADGVAVVVDSHVLSKGNRQLRLAPVETLSPETVYTIRIKDVEDRSGNRNTEPVERTFTTSSGATNYALSVLHSNIAYFQQGVSLNPAITFEFNQPINRLDLAIITLWSFSDRDVVPIQIEATNPYTLVITPTESLQRGRQYELRATIRSLSGHDISLRNHNRFRTTYRNE
ncbi:MAG: Ig-like domain-containing protein [Gammaproteobacteria bacterium]|nr:Ig-like domain-containing protein [Gammaproteobacteria bacterium]